MRQARFKHAYIIAALYGGVGTAASKKVCLGRSRQFAGMQEELPVHNCQRKGHDSFWQRDEQAHRFVRESLVM